MGKVAHIYIYGEIDDDTVKAVKAQLGSQKEAEEIHAFFDSVGGYVNDGYKIKEAILSEGKPYTAIATGKVMSIATIPFLAAQKRLHVKSLGERDIMVHNPWGRQQGDSSDFKMVAEELEEIEDRMSNDYQESTNLTKEEALALMKKETYLSVEKAIEIGFLHGEYKETLQAVAKLDKENKNQNEMSITKEEGKEIKAELSGIKKMLEGFKGLFKSEPKALLVQDANGVEIDFPDLADDAEPSVGDKATVDGSPASGEHLLPDGRTYVFADGALSEIKEAEEEEEMSEEMEALKKENEETKAELEKAKAENETLKAKKAEHEKKEKEFQAKASEIETKFEALQETLKGANLDLDGFQSRGGDGDDEDKKTKSRKLFKTEK